MSTERLAFTVEIARSEQQLRAACHVRSLPYGHHLPGLKKTFNEPDALDHHPDTLVLLATDKSNGEPVGTARLCTSASEQLPITRSICLPDHLQGRVLGEITRLAVPPESPDPAIKLALMKASYLCCLSLQVRWMVIGARSAGLVRGYKRLGFENLFPDSPPVPLAHAGGLPHHVLAFDVTAAERIWHGVSHPLYDWMVGTFHPDIQLFPRGRRHAEAGSSPSASAPLVAAHATH